MEHSRGDNEYAKLDWFRLGHVVALDLGARLAAPAAVLALAHGEAHGAVVSSAVVTGLAGLRAVLAGRLQEDSVRRLWDALVRATRRRPVAELRARPDEHGSAALLDAVALVAHVRASVLTRLAADSLALAAILVATIVYLGPLWLALGATALAVGGTLVMGAQRRMRQADQRAFDQFARVAHDFEVLVEAAPELRAHGCEERHAADLRCSVRKMALEQRRAATYSALMSLFPLGVALLMAAAPLGFQVSSFVQAVGGRLVDAGILGATGLYFGLGLARSAEGWVRSAPQRTALASYFASGGLEGRGGVHKANVRHGDIELIDVSVRYPGAERSTPSPVRFCWRGDSRGLAVTGPNGAGKSTLALCLLGLIEPTHGRIAFDGVAAADIDWTDLRRRTVFVPQQGFIADDRTIEWHLRLLSREQPTPQQLSSALQRVGLWDALEGRISPSGRGPLSVLASQLSGGERKRLQLARALLGMPDLIIVDEPEAGLDQASRSWLRGFLEELGQTSRLLVVAHDPSVIPSTFERITCLSENEPAARGEQDDATVSLAKARAAGDTQRALLVEQVRLEGELGT